MAKYSTGGSSSGGEGEACELCGATGGTLRTATVAGAELLVCRSCAPHADSGGDDRSGGSGGSSGRGGGGSRSGGGGGGDGGDGRRLPRRSQLWDSDTSSWEEEGTGYDSDPLPYLVTGYGERLTEARQDAGLQAGELAAEIDIPEEDLLAIEQGRAARAGVGGAVIAAIEERLDVQLAED